MARLIDADALLEDLKAAKTNGGMGAVVAGTLARYVKRCQTIDAVEVVRCKDCIYWQDNNGGYPHEECRWGHGETPDPEDYCSFGERKEE